MEKLNAQTEAPTHLCIPHLFWAVRDWVGFENLCTMFYDDPELVADMFNYLMVLPNVIAVVALSGVVTKSAKDGIAAYKAKRTK